MLELENKILQGRRITLEEGLRLYQEEDLNRLGRLAQRVRFRLHPKPEVTFVIDTNPNYTNICVTDCLFCAFYRKPGHPEGYALTLEQVMEKIERAVRAGATTVLLQGGHNPDLPLAYYLDLVRETRRRFPGVTPHFFSAPEIRFMAKTSGLTIREVLARLKEAGQTTLPGGGAEILSDRVRRRIAPKKATTAEWLEVHREAHRLGFRTTATMMYGHLETPEDLLEHLDHIRRLQDETGGFTAFIPWSCKPQRTHLTRWVSRAAPGVQYLRILAVARIFLDNFPHIQASWFSEGKAIGQAALHYGADDFGGTLLEEHVHEATGFLNTTTVEETIRLIREAGFIPVQRTTLYERVRSFADEAPREFPGVAREAFS